MRSCTTCVDGTMRLVADVAPQTRAIPKPSGAKASSSTVRQPVVDGERSSDGIPRLSIQWDISMLVSCACVCIVYCVLCVCVCVCAICTPHCGCPKRRVPCLYSLQQQQRTNTQVHKSAARHERSVAELITPHKTPLLRLFSLHSSSLPD